MSKPGRYSKVSRRKWVDEKVMDLSFPPPNGFTLFDRLLTGPELSNVPGLFIAWEGGLSDALHWPLEGFREAFREVSSKGLAEADWKAGLVWVPNSIRHNEPESPNVVAGWENTLADLPDCPLKWRAFAVLEAWCKAKGKAWAEAWRRACPNQEQEQEQEQEHREEIAHEGRGQSEVNREPDPSPAPMPVSAKRFKSQFSDSLAPDSIEFTKEHHEYAKHHGLDLGQTWLECRDHRRANGLRREDWCAEFMYWLRNEVKFKRNGDRSVAKTKGTKPPKQPNGGTFGSAFLAAGAKS